MRVIRAASAAAGLAVSILALSPAAAREAEPTGLWEGRWRTEARHFIEGGATPRQLRHEGSLDALFDFCVSEDGTISGSGRARVTRTDTPSHIRVFDFGTVTYQESFEPSEAEVPVKVTGQRHGNEFRLRLEAGTVDIRQTVVSTWPGAPAQSWSNSFSWPAIGLLTIATSGSNPLPTQITIAAQNGAEQEISSFDVYDDSDAPTRGVAEYRSRLQIRRPKKDAADELPILLGQVFNEDLATISPEGEKSLEMVLPQMRCNPGRTRIRIVTPGIIVTPGEDDIFFEALTMARRDHLKIWLREHGIDPSRIGWSRSGGPEDDVQVKFGR